MGSSGRTALCGLLAALAVILLSLGGMIPFAGIACPMLAMLCLLPTVRRCSARTALAQYAASAILGVLLCPDLEASMLYVFIGWYPALRPKLEKLGRISRLLVKAGIFALALTGMYALLLYVFRLEAVAAEFAEYSAPMTVGLLVMGCAVFLLFDRSIGMLEAAYRRKRRR